MAGREETSLSGEGEGEEEEEGDGESEEDDEEKSDLYWGPSEGGAGGGATSAAEEEEDEAVEEVEPRCPAPTTPPTTPPSVLPATLASQARLSAERLSDGNVLDGISRFLGGKHSLLRSWLDFMLNQSRKIPSPLDVFRPPTRPPPALTTTPFWRASPKSCHVLVETTRMATTKRDSRRSDRSIGGEEVREGVGEGGVGSREEGAVQRLVNLSASA